MPEKKQLVIHCSFMFFFQSSSKLVNHKLQKFLSDPENLLCMDIVREFFNFFNLDYTNAVFGPETNTVSLR